MATEDDDRGDGSDGLDLTWDAMAAGANLLDDLAPLVPGLSLAMNQLGPMRRARAKRLFDDLIKAHQIDPGWFMARVEANPALPKLLADVGRHVLIDEDFEEKRDAYQRVLEVGIWGDDSQIDEARMVADTVAALKPIAVAALARTDLSAFDQTSRILGLGSRFTGFAISQLVGAGILTQVPGRIVSEPGRIREACEPRSGPLRREPLKKVPFLQPGRTYQEPRQLQLTDWGRVVKMALEPAPDSVPEREEGRSP